MCTTHVTASVLVICHPVLPNACETSQLGEVSAKTIICWQTESYTVWWTEVTLGLPTNNCLSADFAELKCLAGIRQDGAKVCEVG